MKLSILLMGAAVGSALIAGQAAAQGAGAPANVTGLSEVIVTAERRAVDVQRTPLSITAVGGDTLRDRGVDNTFDLQRNVPSLSVSQGNNNNAIFVNGVGGGAANLYGSPTVAFNVDEITLSQNYGGSTSFYDLQRVEVLKGPQGTLYGRNATGGAINLLPNPPVHHYEGAASVQFGNYNDVEINGMINIPVTDTVAFRAAFNSVKHDGYITNGLFDANAKAARLQLLFDPSDTFSLRLAADYFRSDALSSTGEVPIYPGRSLSGRPPALPGFTGKFLNPSNKWTGFTSDVTYPVCISAATCAIRAGGATGAKASPLDDNLPARLPLGPGPDAKERHKQLILSAHMRWDLGWGVATVIPGYVKTLANDFLYVNLRTGIINMDASQRTLEARLASEPDSKLIWVAGAYYYHQAMNARQDTFKTNEGYAGFLVPDLHSTAWAVFGQATWPLTNTVRATGGVRYTSETSSQNGYFTTPFATNFPPPYGNPLGRIPSVGTGKYNATTWLVRGEWDVAPQSMLFASVSTGFKAGGLNPGTSPNTYQPENITAYEVGSKNRFFDNRLQVNLDGFYWDYRNQQIGQLYPTNPCPDICTAFITVAAKQSTIWGVEADMQWLLTANTRVGLNVIRQEGKFDDYRTLAISQLNRPSLIYNGNDRPYTPHWVADLSLQQSFPVGDGAKIVFFANTHWQSTSVLVTNLDPAIPDELEYQKAYHLSNASLAYQRDAWSVAAYVQNIENAFIVTGGSSAGVYGGWSASPMPPRTYGIRIKAKF